MGLHARESKTLTERAQASALLCCLYARISTYLSFTIRKYSKDPMNRVVDSMPERLQTVIDKKRVIYKVVECARARNPQSTFCVPPLGSLSHSSIKNPSAKPRKKFMIQEARRPPVPAAFTPITQRNDSTRPTNKKIPHFKDLSHFQTQFWRPLNILSSGPHHFFLL